MENISIPAVLLLSHTPNPEQLIERAGRICYKSECKITKDSAPQFIKNLIKRGHESVLEHASATFLISCDRGVSHEIVRHRLCSFSQESTRYCDYSKKGLTFLSPFDNALEIPTTYKYNQKVYDIWDKAISQCEESYKELRKIGVPSELARSVLPNALKTEIVVTANFRNIRHMIRLRTDKHAHPQIRQIFQIILDRMLEIAPSVFGDLVPAKGEVNHECTL